MLCEEIFQNGTTVVLKIPTHRGKQRGPFRIVLINWIIFEIDKLFCCMRHQANLFSQSFDACNPEMWFGGNLT
ncbi:MAG: hypothetical protein EB086_12330 [Rhodobacteraceae bacterium]|nr:hypothetical protein [Paracoccaceae bacterium]